MNDFKKDFKKLSENIIVDSSAGLGYEANCAMELADELIIVTNPEIAAITDALKAVRLAQQMKIPIMGTIVTRVRRDDLELQPETVKEMLEVPILGMVPEDLVIKRALCMKDAVVHTHPGSDPARAYKEIAAKILGIEYDSRKDREGFFKRILNKIRKK